MTPVPLILIPIPIPVLQIPILIPGLWKICDSCSVVGFYVQTTTYNAYALIFRNPAISCQHIPRLDFSAWRGLA